MMMSLTTAFLPYTSHDNVEAEGAAHVPEEDNIEGPMEPEETGPEPPQPPAPPVAQPPALNAQVTSRSGRPIRPVPHSV